MKLSEKQVKKVLANPNDPRFLLYATHLFSRVPDPKTAFCYIDKFVFCQKWPVIKKRMKKDAWVMEKIPFWQAIYNVLLEQFRAKGDKVRIHEKKKPLLELKTVACQIRELRKKRGYTQKELAKRMHVVQSYISKIERGENNISVETLSHVAHILKVKLVVQLENKGKH